MTHVVYVVCVWFTGVEQDKKRHHSCGLYSPKRCFKKMYLPLLRMLNLLSDFFLELSDLLNQSCQNVSFEFPRIHVCMHVLCVCGGGTKKQTRRQSRIRGKLFFGQHIS